MRLIRPPLTEDCSIKTQSPAQEGKFLFLICAVDACNVPGAATSAGNDDTLTRITTHQVCLIPDAGQMAEEILHLLWLCQETLRLVGQMLQTALKEHRQGQFVGVRRDVRMLRVAEGTRRIVHRTDDVTGEG